MTVFEVGKNYYSQVFLEELKNRFFEKNINKERQTEIYFHNNYELMTFSDEETLNEEYSNEKQIKT